MAPRSVIIGIDLGTTNSCAAYVAPDGKVKLVPYRSGEFTIPSVFAIDDKGNELVGHEAKRQWQLNPGNTIHASKRLIGRQFRSEVVDVMTRLVAYRMRERDGDVQLEAGGRAFHTTDISAKLLAKIRDVAQDFLKVPVERAVVTVPAYFNDRQRQAVKEAGGLVNLDVVHVINEPTSAAMAYGIGKGLNQTVLVYDLGGGTFDVSIIEIRDRVFEVKATGGDIFLGGLDFDGAMIRHVLEDFQRRHGVDLSGEPVAMQRIKDLVERTKIDLSTRATVPFQIPFIAMSAQGQPLNVELTFTRQLLEQLCGGLIDRTMAVVEQVMADAKMKVEQIDEVLLVGGQTRMPLIQDRLTRYFGKAPSKGVHPDEAVAVGAALYAHSLQDDTNLRLQLLDVLSLPIGIEAAGKVMHVVFPRNAAVPNARQLKATTSYDGQTDVVVRIYQGEHAKVERNELLGEFTFAGQPSGPAGRASMEITFDVNVEGILTARARDLASGREMKTTIRVTGA